MKNCPNCNYTLDRDYNFCPSCGIDLRKPQENNSEKGENEELKKYIICDVCGEEVEEGSEYCGSCGARVTGKEKTVLKGSVKSDTAKSEVKPSQKQSSSEKTIERKPQAKRPQVSQAKKDMPQNAGKEKPVVSQGKKMTPLKIGGLIGGLLLAGVLIMWASGVFSSGSATEANNLQQQQEGNAAVSLENVQRINELEAAVRKDSTNLSTVLELAHLLNDSGLKERSIPYYMMYLREDPNNADVQVDLGVVYYEMQRYDIAKSRMRKGLAINPRHQIANFNMGIVNLAAGSIDSAKTWWSKAVSIDPTSEIGKKAKELLDSHK